MLTNDHNSIEIFKVSQNVFSLMSANELMTFMPPCSDFCKVVHSRRTLWVKKSFIDRCHQSHQLVFPFAVCWNDWRSESYTLYFMVLSLIWCDGVNVTEVLLSIHGFGFVRGSWSWWAAGSGNVWSQLRRSEILAGARRRQNLYGILLPGANIFRAFFRTGLVALWFALPFKPPISSPMPIRVWSDSILCKLIFSISSGHFRTRSLSWSFWQTDVLEAFFCSRNCAMCQLARMLYGRTFKWLIDAPLVWRVTFCDCCLDRFLRLNGIFVFLMASMSTITSCWCYEEKINDRLRESSTSQVHPSAWGVKLLFLESVETAWGDEECSSYTESYIYIVYLISYTYTSVHIFS